MKHYVLHDWLDYVCEKVVEDEKRKAMRMHLKSGCATCSELFEFWTRVRDLLKREDEYQVPESAVRHAKRAFATTRKRSRVLIPTLSFDSFWEALPVGMRSSLVSERALQFQLNTMQIRLRAENKTAPLRVWLDGQLVDESDETKPLNDLRVSLVRGGASFSETRTNQFGEFHFDFKPNQDIELVVDTYAGDEIVVPLAEFCPEAKSGG
jgi:hypothetical protein